MFHPEIDFPEEFSKRVKDDPFLGSRLLDALQEKSPISIRLNPHKMTPEFLLKKSVHWCEHAWYLDERPNYTLDPLFHSGSYYPQEAGSMVLDYVLRSLCLPKEPIILDLCAAPGGKSTLISSFLDDRGLLVSNEIHPQRASILRENLTKWGCHNALITNNNPSDFERLPDFFDVMVIDAPCSGEGMFRKDRKTRTEWSQSNVRACAKRQKEIIESTWHTLKSGGYLIYSTCTFNRIENEDMMQWAIEKYEATPIALDVPRSISIDRRGLGWYCIPGVSESEGFYISVLQKTEAKTHAKRKTYSNLKKIESSKEINELIEIDRSVLIRREEWIYAIPEGIEEQMLHIQSQLKILKFGVAVGKMAKKGLVPSEELPYSKLVRRNAIRSHELTRLQALSYLKGESFTISAENGWCLVTYRGQALGWIKQLDLRFNNFYPKEWRIRTRIHGT
jgi:16S rRNA C967 or C1407 C5-methylase (RsmB/RsmF family)/NOL1/NOP2/fmu family ribosome biogenesis protein